METVFGPSQRDNVGRIIGNFKVAQDSCDVEIKMVPAPEESESASQCLARLAVHHSYSNSNHALPGPEHTNSPVDLL